MRVAALLPYDEHRRARMRGIAPSQREGGARVRCARATLWRAFNAGVRMTRSTQSRTIVKQCACGATYDEAGWGDLPLVGVVGDAAYGRESLFEIRQCTCRSSLAIRKVRGEIA